MTGMVVYCEFAEEFEEGEPCPHTGQVDCLHPICPMIETGDASFGPPIDTGLDQR